MYNPDVEEFQGSKSATADELMGIKSSEEETKAEPREELSHR